MLSRVARGLTPRRAYSTRRPIVGGNWKCNPATAASLPELVQNYAPISQSTTGGSNAKVDIYVAPSTLHVPLVKDDLKALGIGVATQNCNFTGCGAYTGEMSADQIKDLGCEWVILGHSERRGEFGLPTPKETNALLKTKLQYVLDQGLSAVFCIGEPLPIREKGIGPVLSVLATQLVDLIGILKALEDKSRVVIAYEPVWAIGTGVAATAEQAQETRGAAASHTYTADTLTVCPVADKGIRDWIEEYVDEKTAHEIRIQYGGSATAENAPELSNYPDIDGFLVGGASLKPEICEIVKEIAVAKNTFAMGGA